MKALVVGDRGQLGRCLLGLLGGDVAWSGDREDLDVCDAKAVAERISRERPEVVFNATAYNAVDAAETAVGDAMAVNALGPRNLAMGCKAAGALLVHVSTDYVFDGTATRPYTEGDAPCPINAYGISKLAGERLVQTSGCTALIVRTSGVMGRGGSPDKGGSFVERILARARRGDPLWVVDDQTFAPTSAPDLAQALVRLVEAGARGLVHVTNAGSCTWHGLARWAVRHEGLDVEVRPIRSEELGLAARRPTFSVLACERYADLGLPPLRPWPEALATLLHA